jgi:hypothetical protein
VAEHPGGRRQRLVPRPHIPAATLRQAERGRAAYCLRRLLGSHRRGVGSPERTIPEAGLERLDGRVDRKLAARQIRSAGNDAV